MQRRSEPESEQRHHPRLKLPPMYTLIRVRPHGDSKFCWTGHIYDISESGLRFELDAGVQPGTSIDIRATLPGAHSTTVNMTGRVVRYHDEPDDLGPQRMGVRIDSFLCQSDRHRLAAYLRHNGMTRAA